MPRRPDGSYQYSARDEALSSPKGRRAEAQERAKGLAATDKGQSNRDYHNRMGDIEDAAAAEERLGHPALRKPKPQ